MLGKPAVTRYTAKKRRRNGPSGWGQMYSPMPSNVFKRGGRKFGEKCGPPPKGLLRGEAKKPLLKGEKEPNAGKQRKKKFKKRKGKKVEDDRETGANLSNANYAFDQAAKTGNNRGNPSR